VRNFLGKREKSYGKRERKLGGQKWHKEMGVAHFVNTL